MYDTHKDNSAASDNLDVLMTRFNRNEFDLVAVGRAILDDPEWPRKARVGDPFKPFDKQSLEVLR
jgi:2,4-dienoyl-CoA reductase-like NADH-dependent reductase (Old Yellow Enzyme family)